MSTEKREFSVGLVAKHWTEENGIISIVLPPTDGTTGEQWIARTEKKGNRVGDYAKQLLSSPDFRPTTGVVYVVKVLKGELFSDENRTTDNARAKAAELKFGQLNAEAACLIREQFTDAELQAMGLMWIIVMHESIKDADGDLWLLAVSRGDDGWWLFSSYADPGYRWNRDDGFAFAAPQVVPQA